MCTPQLGSEIRRDVAACGAGIVGRPDRLPPQQHGSRLQVINHVDIVDCRIDDMYVWWKSVLCCLMGY
jgi:hypothetical protein